MPESRQQPYVTYEDRKVRPDGFFIPEGVTKPVFSTTEVAKVFYGLSAAWLRWRERDGDIVLDGTPISPSRARSNIRKYTLYDIERMTHALNQHGAINRAQMLNALNIVWYEAMIHGLVSISD